MDSEQSSAAAKVRLLARSGQLKVSTTGLAPTIQANLLVLPSKYASDFILLCKRNPVPCPLLSVIPPGSGFSTSLAPGSDIRTDLPAYNVYNTGKLIHDSIPSIEQFWSKTDDYTGFLIGCSYSFETALSKHNLAPPHMVRQMIVSMYTTTTRLLPAGVFTEGTMVVSMRPYKWSDIPRVRDITRPYHTQHGEPIAWGWAGAKSLGVEEKVREGVVDWGEWVDGLTWAEEDGEETDAVVPVFWGCGVTPQQVVLSCGDAIKGNVMSHKPGQVVFPSLLMQLAYLGLCVGCMFQKIHVCYRHPRGRSILQV